MRKKQNAPSPVLFDVAGVRSVPPPPSTKKKEREPLDLTKLGFNSVYKDFGNYIKKRGNSTP